MTDKEDATIEDPMSDAQKALEWIRACRKEYCIGKGQLALLGFSGGAHLAAATATHGPQRPDVLLLGYPGILHSDLRALECPDIVECIDEKTPPQNLIKCSWLLRYFSLFLGEGIYNLVSSFKSIRLFKKNSFLNERFVRTYYLFKNGYNSISYDLFLVRAG